jgi:hypothetical protein
LISTSPSAIEAATGRFDAVPDRFSRKFSAMLLRVLKSEMAYDWFYPPTKKGEAEASP